MALEGFLGGFAQSVQGLPSLIMQKRQMAQQEGMQRQQLELQKAQEQRIANAQSREQIAKTLEVYDNIINYVPDAQRPAAIKGWLASIEQQSGAKLPNEVKAALSSGSPEMSQMLVQSFMENPQINGSNLGQVLNNEAMVGMMISHGKKQRMAEESKKLEVMGQQALTGDTTEVRAAGEREIPNEGRELVPLPMETVTVKGTPSTPENTKGLQEKAARLEQLLARPDIPKELRDTYEQVLTQTRSQLGASVDDQNEILTTAREFSLDPANPQHMQLIKQITSQRKAGQVGAEEQARQFNQPVSEAVARDTGVNPLQTVGEVRAQGDGLRLKSPAEAAGEKKAAEENATTVQPGTAAEVGISPFVRQGEARQSPAVMGLRLPTAAEAAGKKAAAEQDVRPVEPTLARDTGINPLLRQGEARSVYGDQGLRLPSESEKVQAGEEAKDTAKRYSGYAEAANVASQRAVPRQQLRAVLPHVTTGLGAAQRAQLDRAAGVFGIQTKGLPATQVADMLTKEMATNVLNSLKGAASEGDREFAINSIPSIQKDKNATYIFLDFQEVVDNRALAKAKALQEYKRHYRGRDASTVPSFEEEWTNYEKANPLQPRFETALKKYGYGTAASSATAKLNAPATAPAEPLPLTPAQTKEILGEVKRGRTAADVRRGR